MSKAGARPQEPDESDEEDGISDIDFAEEEGEWHEEADLDDEDLPEAEEGGDQEDGQGDDDDDEDEEEDAQDDAVHVFRGHSDSIFAVACNPVTTGLVATGGGDDVAYLWGIGESEEYRRLEGHTDSVSALAFSADGTLLATGGLDGLVQIWDAHSGELRHRLEGPAGGIEWVAWHPRGPVLLAGAEDMSVWMWNAASAAFMALLSGHAAAVTCGSFTPDGKGIVTGSADGTLRLWNPKSGETTHTVAGHGFHSEGLTSLHISADSMLALTASTDKTAALVSLTTGKAVGLLEGHTDSVEAVGICSSLPLAATGSLDSKLLIWDLNTRQVRNTHEHPDGVVKVLWHSALVYSACVDGRVRVWDGRSERCERTFSGHSQALLDLALTADGAFILTGSDDKTARVFGI